MKSVSEMTADEIAAARKSGATVYGARLGKLSETGRPIYSDIEDFNPAALQAQIASMRQRGWRLAEEWTNPQPEDPEGDL